MYLHVYMSALLDWGDSAPLRTFDHTLFLTLIWGLVLTSRGQRQRILLKIYNVQYSLQ